MLRLFFSVLAFAYTGLSAQNFIKKFESASNITAVDGKIFFVADDGVHGSELWITDGTPEGTRLVKDIYPGFEGASPAYLTSFNGQLFFVASSLQYGNEVWKSDGTEAGTVLLKDIYTGDGNGSDPRALTLYNNELYFDASPDGFFRSVYKSNGTSGGTVVLKDMGLGEISDIEVAGNYLFYAFGSNGIINLWRTDGTPGGTVQVPVDSYFYLRQLTAVDNQLFFTTSYTENVEVRLYSLNGTSAPIMLKEYVAPSGTNALTNFTAVGTKLFFSIQKNYDQPIDTDELWWSDGTIAGTAMVKSFDWNSTFSGTAMKNFFSFNNTLYFQNGATMNDAWWKSDGTDAGTLEVSPVRLGNSQVGQPMLVVSDGKLFMSGDGQLWTSDGTTAGTKELYRISQGFSSNFSSLADVSGLLYFTASDDYGMSIWNAAPSAEITVTDVTESSIISDSEIEFESVPVNACSSQIIKIRNVGAKELIISEVMVSGKDFYVSGQVPGIVNSNEDFLVEVFFLPYAVGNRTGTITIRNNDTNENNYVIHLSGVGTEGTSTSFCESYENGLLTKSLTPAQQGSITISNNTIQEKSAVGTVIGTLSAGGPGYTYSLVSGTGDADNGKFFIDGSSLKSLVSFNHSMRDVYTLRVQTQGNSPQFENQLTVIVLEELSNTLPVSECVPDIKRINTELLDAAYNEESHLFVCGAGGKLLKSTDGGNTWADLNSGVTSQLARIIFKGSSGYVAGDGVLLKSEDNGDSWFQLYVPSESQIVAKTLFFLDADNGYAATFSGDILKTTDGGINWKLQSRHFSDEPTTLFFWNEDEGIISTSFGSVHKTSNQGVTWTPVNVSNLGQSNLFTSINFIDDQKGFMTSLTNLYSTEDGGEHWTEVSGISGVYFQEARFVTSDIGYILGGYSSNELFVSTNGGATWDAVDSSPLSGAHGIAYDEDNNKVVVVGANSPAIDQTEPGSAILSATTGATSWEIKHELSSDDFNQVIFPSSQIGYVAGSNDMYKTTNGGITWKKQGLQKPIYGISFLDDENGYMADGFKIYKTSNGGTDWVESYTSGAADLKKVIVLSANNVVAYSEGEKIYRYNGTGWSTVFNGPLNNLRQVQFPTNSVGYGVDQLGKVIKTTNGGASWSTVYTHSASGESFNTIYFINANEGFIAGVNGVLYKTINGGVNWLKVFSGIPAEIRELEFSDPLTGYAFTEEGSVFKSEDGGQHWTFMGVLSFTGLTDVSKAGNSLYYCGKYGSLGTLVPPKAPLMPGYISGDELVCDGDVAEYAVALNDELNYYWNVPGAGLTVNGGQASVKFKGAGQYTLSVQHYTSCGTSTVRTLSITVTEPPETGILGPQVVAFNSTEEFTIQNPDEESFYNWNVTGATSFEATGENISVTWGKDPGIVSVIETTNSGCRSKATMMVTIDPSTIVGISDANVIEAGVLLYPNPTADKIFLESHLSSGLNVRVYNLMGQQYATGEMLPFGNNMINLAGFPSGLYLVEVSDSSGSAKSVRRIIKN